MRVATVMLLALACALAATTVDAATPAGCSGSPNTHTLYTGEPTLVKEVSHGKLYNVGPSENTIQVLHLFGSPYEMGQAQGALLKDEIHGLLGEFYQWIDGMVEQYAKFLPKELVEMVVDFGIEVALEMQYIVTEPYTPSWFIDEMKGIADGAGLPYSKIAQINSFSELIRASCTAVMASGRSTTTGSLVQLRALDWGVDNPMRTVPIAAIYHPQEGNGHEFYSQTFPGIIGTLTGYSSDVAVCEKVWIHSNDTFFDNRFGTPWATNLRSVLQFSETNDDAIQFLTDSRRTASIFVGLGDHATESGRLLEYSNKQLNVFNWNTPFPGYAKTPPEHPEIEDVVYVDKHTQPSSDPCLANILTGQWGDITADSFRTDLVNVFQTGDLQCAIYDFGSNTVQVAVATQNPAATGANILPAYERQFIQLNMTQLFAETAPTVV